MTTRSRKVRSCDTVTTAAGVEPTNRSSRSRPAKSRSLVGSSRSSTSWRDSRMAASAARAAWPPDRWPTSTSRRSAGRPTSASTAPVRASRSSPPMARKWSRAVAVGLDRVGVVAHGRRRGVEAVAGRRHAGAAGQVRAQASRPGPRPAPAAGSPTVVVAGDRSTRPGVGLLEPGQDPQQRRLPDAVRPHDPEPGARRDRHRHPAQHHLPAVVPLDVPRHEHDRRRYRPTTAAPCGDSSRIPTGSATG